jgi:hypothetical protein
VTFETGDPAEIKTKLDLLPQTAGSSTYRACGTPPVGFRVFNASYASFRTSLPAGADLEIEVQSRSHPQQAFGLEGGRLRRHVFSTTPNAVGAAALPTTIHTLDLPRAGSAMPETIYADLAQPSFFIPYGEGSLEDLNVDGAIEKVCVTAQLPAPGPASISLDRLRFYAPTTGDKPPAETGLLVGGIIDGRSDTQPAALAFVDLDSGTTTVITLDRGFYLGKVPMTGRYELHLIRASCDAAPPMRALLERNSLDLDLTVEGCAIHRRKAMR